MPEDTRAVSERRGRAVAFDLGGTHLRSAIVGPDYKPQHFQKQKILSTPDALPSCEIWRLITDAMLCYERSTKICLSPGSPIIISFPGPIADHRRVLQAPTVAGSTPVPNIAEELELATGRRVLLINDISAAAWYFATLTESTRFIVVTVSSGIGSKIFDRGHPSQVIDNPPYAGEIGHYVVDDTPDALTCDCGGKGHLCGISSGRGIEKAARLRALRRPDEFSRSELGRLTGGRPELVRNEDNLIAAALNDDEWTWRLIEDCTRPLARTLLCVLMAYGLEQIFVMGGFAQSLGLAYEALLRRLFAELSGYQLAADRARSSLRVWWRESEPSLEGCGAFLRSARRAP